MDKTCLTCLHGCDNCPPSDMPRACHGCDLFDKWEPKNRMESVQTTVSLREAIRLCTIWLDLLRKHEGLPDGFTPLEIVLEAAIAYADAIDNDDPDGMQDRNCGTCKHEGLDMDEGPCRGCVEFFETCYYTQWEPKEDA